MTDEQLEVASRHIDWHRARFGFDDGVRTAVAVLLATVLLGLDYLDWLLDVRPTDLGLFAGFSAAIRTRIGIVEGSRVLLVALTFFLAGGARAGRVAGLLAMLAVVIGAAAGHPATIEPALALPANALHLGAAAIWLGGVLLLAVSIAALCADRRARSAR